MTPEQQVAHVIGLERALLRPECRGDAARLDRLLHADFQEIGASGRLWRRAEMVEAMLADPGTEVIADHEMSGTQVADGLVMLVYLSDSAGRRARRTSWWRRGADDAWQVFHHQGTITAGPGTAP